LTLVGDLAKGIVAVLLSKGICELLGTGLTAQNDVHFIGYIAGIFAILGHVFPIYYHFKGGKGVLVGVSVFLGIDWKVFLCLIVIFAVVLAISKYVSLGSIIAAACCPVVTFLFQFWQRGDLPMWYLWLNTGLAALMGAWVIYMHRTNIQRLKAGNENKFSFHSKKA
jgi:glycerol-3-phosphate acyltransferase PlsY